MTRFQRWGTAAALLAFGAAGLAVAQTSAKGGGGKGKDQQEQKAQQGQKKGHVARVGQQAFADPKTGKLISEPTQDQIQALEIAVAEMLTQDGEDLPVVQLPDGSLTVDLEGRFQEIAIATVAPDGKLMMGCVNHPDQVKQVLKPKPAPQVTRKATPLEVK